MSEMEMRYTKKVEVVESLESARSAVVLMYTEHYYTEYSYVNVTKQEMYTLIEEFQATGYMTIPNIRVTGSTKKIKPAIVRFLEETHAYIVKESHAAWTDSEEEPKSHMTILDWMDWQKAWYDRQIQNIKEQAIKYGMFPRKKNK